MAHFAESFNLLTACWSVLGVRAVAWGVVVPDVMTLTLPLPIRTETGWRELSLGGGRGGVTSFFCKICGFQIGPQEFAS